MRKIEDTGELDVVKLASWMGVDDSWLRHVLEYGFGCGCTPDPEADEPNCNIWKALQDKLRAEMNLARAEKEFQIAVGANKGMELGR
jgi:hypothetical protein